MDDTLKALERTRDGYETERGWCQFMLDSYTGGGGYQGTIQQPEVGWWGAAAERYAPWATRSNAALATLPANYLDRFPREDRAKFAARLRAAYLWNFVEPLTNLKCSFMLAKPHIYAGQPRALAEWREDVDGEGTSWDELRSPVALAAAIWGWIPVLVDMDPAMPGESMAQARARGAGRPRAIPLSPGNLVDYAHDGRRFRWAKVRTDHVEQEAWDAPPVEVSRYRIWTPTTVEVFEVRRPEHGQPAVAFLGTNEHPFGQVPIAIFRHAPVPGDPVKGLAMHAGPATAQKRLYNLLSELDEHMRAQVFATAVLATKNGAPSGEVTIGTDNCLWLDAEAKQKHYYMSPDPGIADVYERRIDVTIREGIYRPARVEFSRPTGHAVSGTARAYEFSQTNHAIGDFAAEMARGEAWMDAIAWAGLGGNPDGLASYSITAQTDFDVEQLSTDIENTLTALRADLGQTMSKRLRVRLAQRLDPHMPPEIRTRVEAEIDEAVASQDEREALVY